MPDRTKNAIARSDRVLVGALAIVLATASAAVGASLVYHPRTENVVAKAAPAPASASAPQTSTVKVRPGSVMAQLLQEHHCLAEVMYYEARGEGAAGEKAVAEVVFHRLNHGDYGHSICAVVNEGAGKPGCQFSFTCNGAMKKAKQPKAWHRAEVLAARILTGEVPLKNTTGGATNFHAVSVSPAWAGTLEKTTQIGNHVFYRGTVRTRAS